MKPLLPPNEDPIFNRIDESWEPLSTNLLASLEQIPRSMQLDEQQGFGKLIHILNFILFIWLVGFLGIFREPIVAGIERVTSTFLGSVTFTPILTYDPLFLIIIFGVLGVGWLKSELEGI